MQSTAQSLADLFNDARALEKVLKLVQGLVQITASVQRSSIASMGMSTATGSKGVGMSMGSRSRREVEEVVRRWEGARGQIALCRSISHFSLLTSHLIKSCAINMRVGGWGGMWAGGEVCGWAGR